MVKLYDFLPGSRQQYLLDLCTWNACSDSVKQCVHKIACPYFNSSKWPRKWEASTDSL